MLLSALAGEKVLINLRYYLISGRQRKKNIFGDMSEIWRVQHHDRIVDGKNELVTEISQKHFYVI